MTSTDELVDQLRADIGRDRAPIGPGPDVATIRRGGLRRRGRARLVTWGGTVALGVACVAGASALSTGVSQIATAPAPPMSQTAVGTSNQEQVQEIMESALDRAGVTHPDAQLTSMTGEFDSVRGYRLAWTVPATDGGNLYRVEFSVFPGAVPGDDSNEAFQPECSRERPLQEQRSCVLTVAEGGSGWVEHYEVFEQGWWDDVLRTNEWQPRASAALADDTAVMMSVRRDYGPGPEVAADDVTPYAAGIDAPQLGAAVSSAELATIELP